jgi:hypothetical protein
MSGKVHACAASAAIAFSAVLLPLQAAYAQVSDPVVLTFSTVGDSRQDPVNPDPSQLPVSAQDQRWLQNSKAWSRIMRTVQGQKPQMLFFNGDMIMGYGKAAVPAGWSAGPPTAAQVASTDIVKFYTQYAFWRGMVANLMETGTYVVPVAGNHEVQCNSANQTDTYNQPTCPSGKNAQVENEAAWAANMGDLILDNSRLTNMFGTQAPNNASFSSGADDGLATDQSKLSFSFDFKGSHFVVINTDPVGKDATAPTTWLANDMAAAKARGNTHFFVFGHKPAYTYAYLANTATPAGGLDAAPGTVALRDAFWDVIEQYGATYFCGHEHILNVMQPRLGNATKPGTAYQVLVGSGGSPFDAKLNVATRNPATDRSYGWATINVHQSGKVDINAYAFDSAYGPTQLIQSISLAH